MTDVVEDAPGLDGRDPDDRPAPSRLQRRLISVVVLVLLLASAARHAPEGVAHEQLNPLGSAVLSAVGLEMDWVLFAPNPADRTTDVVVRITWVDGESTEWRPPAIEPWVGAYSRYRYGKLAEFSVRGPQAEWAGPQLLDSVVRREAQRRGVAVERAALVIRTHPPAGDRAPVWTEEVLVTIPAGSAP